MKRTVLGLYLSEKNAQAAVIEQNSSRHTLVALHEWDNTLFDYAGDDTPGMDEFVDRMSEFSAPYPVHIQQARVALDTSLLFMNTFPAERALPREQLEEQLEWELTEYFPGSPKNTFISDIHLLARGNSKRYDSVLGISARRDQIRALHRALGRLHFTLDIVDSDHFSADTTLRLNYPETSGESLALVGVKEERIDCSLVRYNELESFSYTSAPSHLRIVEYIENLSRSTNGLESIFLFGTNLDDELLQKIKEFSAVRVEVLNPFRMVDIATGVHTLNDPTITPFRYAAAVGVALREE